MASLVELQRDFSEFVWGGAPGVCTDSISGAGFTATQRLSIYRNNAQLGLTQALRQAFPILERLAGKNAFKDLALSFIRFHPPQSGSLLSFGESFAAFLDNFEDRENRPFFADLAHLEWSLHEAYFDSDRPSLEASDLAGVSPEDYGRLRFCLQPSVRLLASDYPVLAIWQSGQDNLEIEPLLANPEGCRIAIYRAGWNVETRLLSDSEYRFLKSIGNGLSLAEAGADRLKNDSAFEPTELLCFCLSQGLFADFTIESYFKRVINYERINYLRTADQ